MGDFSSELTGHTIGGCRLVERLGRGGMGAVFRAVQINLGRTVALKVLHPERATGEFLQRFRREAQVVARLNHPDIVQIHDAGEDAGYRYIIMEFVEGETLGQKIRRDGALPIIPATNIIRKAAIGLTAAHRQGLVHRDIKPDNLLVTPEGQVKIADFGLAKATEGAGSEDVTQPGQVMGTPQYMSPEQCRGERAGPPTDIYALGITYFHALAGRLPFEGKRIRQFLKMHLRQAPPDLRTLRPDVPTPISAIVSRMLAKDLSERYTSGAEVVAALEKAEQSLGATHDSPTRPFKPAPPRPNSPPAPPTPPTDPSPPASPDRRSMGPVAFGFLSATLLVGILVAFLYLNGLITFKPVIPTAEGKGEQNGESAGQVDNGDSSPDSSAADETDETDPSDSEDPASEEETSNGKDPEEEVEEQDTDPDESERNENQNTGQQTETDEEDKEEETRTGQDETGEGQNEESPGQNKETKEQSKQVEGQGKQTKEQNEQTEGQDEQAEGQGEETREQGEPEEANESAEEEESEAESTAAEETTARRAHVPNPVGTPSLVGQAVVSPDPVDTPPDRFEIFIGRLGQKRGRALTWASLPAALWKESPRLRKGRPILRVSEIPRTLATSLHYTEAVRGALLPTGYLFWVPSEERNRIFGTRFNLMGQKRVFRSKWGPRVIRKGRDLRSIRLAPDDDGLYIVGIEGRHPFVMRLGAGGNPAEGWKDPLRLDANVLHVDAATDTQGGVYLGTTIRRGDQTFVAVQHLDPKGRLLWADDPIGFDISGETDADTLRLLPDGRGGVLVGWETSRVARRLWLQRLNASGQALWKAGGVPVTLPGSNVFWTRGFEGGVGIVTSSDAGIATIKAIRGDGLTRWDNAPKLPVSEGVIADAAEGAYLVIGREGEALRFAYISSAGQISRQKVIGSARGVILNAWARRNRGALVGEILLTDLEEAGK